VKSLNSYVFLHKLKLVY